MNFEHIPVERLHDVWPKVRTGLARIQIKSPEPWTAEDVQYELLGRRASLHFGTHDNEYRGFFVAHPLMLPYVREPALNVWVLYAPSLDDGNHADALQFREAADAEFERIAKGINATRIRFSGRRGWERMMPTFKVAKVLYERMI